MKPSDQQNATNEACRHSPYRDWCRACVGSTGRSDAYTRRHEEQNSSPVASMDHGFFTDGDYDEHSKGATQFLVVKVKPSMMIWSMPVRCQGVEDQAAIEEMVESLNRLGYPELIIGPDNEPGMLAFRDAVIRELKERFGVRAIAQAPPTHDSASAGMVETAIKQVQEEVRTLVIATRELHGIVMDAERVALAWCVRFAGQIMSRTVNGADGLAAFQRAFQRTSIQEPCFPRGEKRSCTWKRARKRFRSQTSFWTVSSWASRSRSGLFSSASVERPGDCCQMTSSEEPKNQESNRCESMYALCILTFLFQSTRKQPSYVECTSEVHSSWPDMGTPLDASAAKQR